MKKVSEHISQLYVLFTIILHLCTLNFCIIGETVLLDTNHEYDGVKLISLFIVQKQSLESSEYSYVI